MRYATLLCCTLLACGGDEEPAPRLIGTWYAEAPSNPSCGTILLFEPDGVYVSSLFCGAQDGALAFQGERGSYEAYARVVTLVPTRSTCADADGEPTDLDYSVDGNTLTIGNDSGLLVMERIEDDGSDDGSGVVEFGCFEDGEFYAMPWHDIGE
jgi:hypothetical protein